MNNLVIVESPTKARTLQKFLGDKYQIEASMGHVRDLPKSDFGVDIEHNFEPQYIIPRDKKKRVNELKKVAKAADVLWLATDPDREGEAIAWHIASLLGDSSANKKNGQTMHRVVFHEITEEAIKDAFEHPRDIDLKLVDAQQARRILDRLVGYNLSPLLWRKIKKGLSAGRVQSVSVRLICDREEENRLFVPEEYWTITAVFSKKNKPAFEAKLFKYLGESVNLSREEEVKKILDDLQNASYFVENISKKERLKHPAPSFTTSTMQQEAYRKLNFTTRKTMLIAQQLYEGLSLGKREHLGLITYIRTDSTRVAGEARQEAYAFIQEHFGTDFVSRGIKRAAGQRSQGKIQDAHEAIRPTSINLTPDSIKGYLTSDQYKLYRLIWLRFLASQMSPAIINTTTVDIKAGDYVFRATGYLIKFSGFMQVYIEGRDDEADELEKTLPPLKKGEELHLNLLQPAQHFTQPPPRYTEATLVKILEEKGIGRPSTYAPIIETIQKRGYVVKEKKHLYPTELGMVVIDMLKKYFPEIVDVEFTAGMEEKLDSIEEGLLEWTDVLEDFYQPFNETMNKAELEIGKVQVADEVTEEICELCGRNMVVKMGRYGKFLACPGFPECKNTRPYYETIDVACPKCGAQVVLRRSKRGRKFYSCKKYPECEFISWERPGTEKSAKGKS